MPENVFRFESPWILLGLLVLPILGAWLFVVAPGRRPAIRFPRVSELLEIEPSAVQSVHWLPSALRMAVLALLLLAAARPQTGKRVSTVLTEGIDIVVALDVSRSMLAEDFKPRNRLHVAKQTIGRFIRGRRNDRIGLVVFAGRAYTQCPLTTDYGVLQSLLQEIEVGMLEDPTAIGTAIATSSARLKDTEAISKVVILVTDGRSNAGSIDPLTAAELASAVGVKVYTVGVGREGLVDYPDPRMRGGYTQIESDIDEEALATIAKRTEGAFFRAHDPEALDGIFERIDEMEKTKRETKDYTRYREIFLLPAALALLLLLLERGLSATRFRTVPG
ncbi:MAG: aerotolerance regulator BatA [Gemmatimonadetes bacterium]|nr:aerotolerance regulator BatA [Gemmatimonadota bacterium]